MRSWVRIGIFTAAVLILAGAATGVYALMSNGGSASGGPVQRGFPLVRPALAQGGVAFPDPQAGLSAYVKMDASSIDFDALVRDVYPAGMRGAGDNYVIGTILVRQDIDAFQVQGRPLTVPVHVYVDTDGWRVAYLLEDRFHGELFTWTNWDPAADPATAPLETRIFTVLEEALRQTTAYLGETLDLGAVGWYYWADPAATRLGAAARTGEGNIFLEIPSGATLYGPSTPGKTSYSFHGRFGGASLTLTKTGEAPQTLHFSNSSLFFIAERDLDRDVMYTFNSSRQPVNLRLGVALVYSLP